MTSKRLRNCDEMYYGLDNVVAFGCCGLIAGHDGPHWMLDSGRSIWWLEEDEGDVSAS